MATPGRGVPGQIVILNGAPRSGKTSIVRELQARGPGEWINLGVDESMSQLPEAFRPGIGLRPGGERPELEELVVALYRGLWESIASHARLGFNVVVDVAMHESFSEPRTIRRDGARLLLQQPVLFVGVHCPLALIWERRAQSWGQRKSEGDLSEAVQRWQIEVHRGLVYDLELDTSILTPVESAELIAARVVIGPPGAAFGRLAQLS
jgi:chloramphenicol 3-O phosphotransferase